MNSFQMFGQAAAPSNMMFPTAAYLQAAQSAADMQARGMSELGRGLAGGITAAGQAYADYKKMQSGVKGAEKSYETFKDYLDPSIREQFDKQIQNINSDPNISLRDKAAFWDQTKGFIGQAVNQQFALQKQRQEINAAAARQATAMQNEIYIKQLDALNEAKKYEYAAGVAAGAGVGSFGGFGAKPSKAVDLNKRFSFGGTE